MATEVFESFDNRIYNNINYEEMATQMLEGADSFSEFVYDTPKEPIAVEIARKITSKHNQDARALIVGAQGKGKSWLGLTLGYGVACEVARRKGGTWQDYFSLDNIVVMDDKKVRDVLHDIKKHNVYFLDDIGIAWNAREAMSKANKLLNDVFQVFRTENTFVMLSIISDFLIDKVPRNLVNYQFEMDMSLFDYYWSFPKVFYVVPKPREHKPHYHYPRTTESVAVLRFMSPAPPEELTKEYDKVRIVAARELREERMKTDEEREQEKENAKVDRRTKPITTKERCIMANRLLLENKCRTQEEACDFVGCSTKTLQRYNKQYAI